MPGDLDTLDPHGYLPAEGSFLPERVVTHHRVFARMSTQELQECVVAGVVSLAVRFGCTPQQMFDALKLPFDERKWHETVRPEVARIEHEAKGEQDEERRDHS